MTLADGASREVLIAAFPEHWVVYVRTFFGYLLLLAISLFLFWLAGWTAYHTEWFSQLVFLAAILIFWTSHHWFFAMMLSRSLSRIFITNRRVIRVRERLFLSEEMYEISFEKMKTVTADKHGLFQNLFRYGTLKFENMAKITYVPHPNRVARQIEQAMGMK